MKRDLKNPVELEKGITNHDVQKAYKYLLSQAKRYDIYLRQKAKEESNQEFMKKYKS